MFGEKIYIGRKYDMNDAFLGFITTSLVQLFSEMAKGASKKMGENAGKSFYDLLRRKFKKGSYECKTLERLKDKPQSADRQKAFQAVLQEQIETDNDLRERLLAIEEKLQPFLSETTVKVSQKASSIAGNVVQVTGDVINSRFFDYSSDKE